MKLNIKYLWNKELLFQIVVHLIVMMFYIFNRRLQAFDFNQVFLFINYAIASLIINYCLLGRFLYKNRNWEFIIYFMIIVALVIFIEKAFIEKVIDLPRRNRREFSLFRSLLSVMPTITILVGIKFAWDALIKQKYIQTLEHAVKESELQFLKSQLNPHFLFNNMNNLYSYAIEQSPKTPAIILELSAVLRYMLYECQGNFVTLVKETEHLENFINLSKLQIEGRGDVNVQISNISSNYRIAPLILTVFVENAFKHSLSSQIDKIKIEVMVNVNESGILYFRCCNNYLKQSNTDHINGGIGLENVKKRLDLIYPDLYTLVINTDNNLYDVNLTIDLNNTQQNELHNY